LKETADFLSWVGVALVTLLPIINPVSTAVLLLSISEHLSDKERNRQVIWACLYMTAILVAFLFAGHLILVAFGISIPGIRIAGGLVIGILGYRMLFPGECHITTAGKQEARQKPNLAFSPLAVPSLSGPGSIAVVITISSTIDGQSGIDKALAFTAVVVAILITAMISWLVLRGAGALPRILGVNGVDSLSRIMGFLLVCIAIQFAIAGVRGLILDTSYWLGQIDYRSFYPS
jgi:multiple antibiotic resistance protein